MTMDPTPTPSGSPTPTPSGSPTPTPSGSLADQIANEVLSEQTGGSSTSPRDFVSVVRRNDGKYYIVHNASGATWGPYDNPTQANFAVKTATLAGNRFTPGELPEALTREQAEIPSRPITAPESPEYQRLRAQGFSEGMDESDFLNVISGANMSDPIVADAWRAMQLFAGYTPERATAVMQNEDSRFRPPQSRDVGRVSSGSQTAREELLAAQAGTQFRSAPAQGQGGTLTPTGPATVGQSAPGTGSASSFIEGSQQGGWTPPALEGYDPQAVSTLYDAASQAGFTGDALHRAVATALTESGGRFDAYNPGGYVPSLGKHVEEKSASAWQINLNAHADKVPGATLEEKRAWLSDPYNAAQVAFQVSSGGSDFSPWSVWHDWAGRPAEGVFSQLASGGTPEGGAAAAGQAGGGAGFGQQGEPGFGEDPADIPEQRTAAEQIRERFRRGEINEKQRDAQLATLDAQAFDQARARQQAAIQQAAQRFEGQGMIVNQAGDGSLVVLDPETGRVHRAQYVPERGRVELSAGVVDPSGAPRAWAISESAAFIPPPGQQSPSEAQAALNARVAPPGGAPGSQMRSVNLGGQEITLTPEQAGELAIMNPGQRSRALFDLTGRVMTLAEQNALLGTSVAGSRSAERNLQDYRVSGVPINEVRGRNLQSFIDAGLAPDEAAFRADIQTELVERAREELPAVQKNDKGQIIIPGGVSSDPGPELQRREQAARSAYMQAIQALRAGDQGAAVRILGNLRFGTPGVGSFLDEAGLFGEERRQFMDLLSQARQPTFWNRDRPDGLSLGQRLTQNYDPRGPGGGGDRPRGPEPTPPSPPPDRTPPNRGGGPIRYQPEPQPAATIEPRTSIEAARRPRRVLQETRT